MTSLGEVFEKAAAEDAVLVIIEHERAPRRHPNPRTRNYNYNNTARARAAAHISWDSTKDRSARTAPGRQAFNDQFQTDEERSAHFRELARKSALIRSAKARQP